MPGSETAGNGGFFAYGGVWGEFYGGGGGGVVGEELGGVVGYAFEVGLPGEEVCLQEIRGGIGELVDAGSQGCEGFSGGGGFVAVDYFGYGDREGAHYLRLGVGYSGVVQREGQQWGDY